MFADHIDKRVGTDAMEQSPNREGYGQGLLEAGKQNPDVVALCCDLTASTKTKAFADEFPERFVEIGIAEQNLISVASGMAALGKIPFTSSYAMFSPGRSWEQIRTTVCYNDSNVKVIGAHAGVSVGPDGATHQAIEDMAIMRVIPNMIVIAPADTIEAKKAVLAAAEHVGPVYIRLAREKTPVVTTEESPFTIGKAHTVYHSDVDEGVKVGVVATGTLLHNAMMAAKELNEEGVGVTVLHMPTVKPLDEAALGALLEECDFLVTVEEHQAIGGLGSAVAEYVTTNNPKKVIRIGVQDTFGESGDPEELITLHKMDVDSIKETIKDNL